MALSVTGCKPICDNFFHRSGVSLLGWFPSFDAMEFIILTALGAVCDDGVSSDLMTLSFQFEMYVYSPI